MTVLELKELLADAPNDMNVMVMVEDHLKPGLFAFAHACPCDTGISTLGGGEREEGGETVFLILPHGSGVSEEDVENEEDTTPELN